MQQPLTRRNLLDYLNSFENQYPVESWMIKGVHAWPLIKIDLFFRHVDSENLDSALTALNRKKRKDCLLYSVLQASISFFRFLLLFIKKKKRVDVIFSDSSGHRVKYNGSYINRYFKPIIEHQQSILPSFKYLTINDDSEKTNRYPPDEPIFFIHKYLKGSKIWLKIFGRKKNINSLDGFEILLKELGSPKFEYLNVDHKYINHIQKKVDNILTISQIIDVLIEKHSPKVIFELCYYTGLRFGINHSTHEKGVRTVEIQHGGMGADHVSYSGWAKLPAEGYNVFPQTFWLWDDSSNQLIKSWVGNHSYHSVVLGGNPWLTYAKSNLIHYNFPPNQDIILYTLQYSDIPKHILDVIKFSPSKIQWWIRLHPRKLESKHIIINLLSSHGIEPERYEIDRATNYPLPALLSRAYAHLSGSSGSIIEAAQMGVFSVILEKTGEVYYHNLIEEGKAAVAYTTNNVLSLLQDIEKKTKGPTKIQELYKSLSTDIINDFKFKNDYRRRTSK